MRWPLVDLGHGRYDFSSVEPFIAGGRTKHGIEVIWDLFHYGFPPHVDLWSEDFPERFADYCHAAARFIAPRGPTGHACIFTPGQRALLHGLCGRREGACSRPMAQGAAGVEGRAGARRDRRHRRDPLLYAPDARIVNADPLCRVALPAGPTDLARRGARFQRTPRLSGLGHASGRLLPELGGSRDHLDIVGINYYWTNQWEWRDRAAAPTARSRRSPTTIRAACR